MGSVSVIMPVHNGLPYLDASVASVLGQTYSDFEFVILENGSTDGSAERLAEWAAADSRISLHQTPERLGGAGSSRAAVELTRGSLIARMDADDIAHPQRLEQQLDVMREHRDVVLVTTLHGYLDARGKRVRGLDRWPLVNGAPMPFSGGCLMFRRAAYDHVSGYRTVHGTWEDLDLCVRLAQVGRVLVIPRALYWCRFHTTSRTAGTAAAAAVASKASRSSSIGTPEGSHLLSRPPAVGAVFELNAMQLWSGSRPRHLAELRAATNGGPLLTRLAVIAWANWAGASPGSLRSALRWRSRLLDLLVSARIPKTQPREWRPG